jgi:hypothetical protein
VLAFPDRILGRYLDFRWRERKFRIFSVLRTPLTTRESRKQKARFAAGLQGEKALRPMRGWLSNPILAQSLVAAFSEVKRERPDPFDLVSDFGSTK